MLKSSPVWGVGAGLFTSYYPRAAHSSFVQCFAELGLVGYLMWLAIIMLTLDDLRQTTAVAEEEASELRRWSRAVSVALMGFLVGAIFLSRAYDVGLFILLALGSSVGDIAVRQQLFTRARSLPLWMLIVGASAVASIVFYWLYMRLLR
jgi:O-antigen ligase